MLYGIAMLLCIIFIDLVFFSAGLEIFLLFAPWFDAAIIGIFWFIYEFYRTPHEAKILRKCKNEKRIPVITETDSGLLEFDYEVKSTPEGGILTKRNGAMFVPRSIFSANDKETDALKEVHSVVAKRSFIAGVGMPVWFGYTGKGTLTNLRTVAELEHGKEDMRINPHPSQHEYIGTKNRLVQIFWPVPLKTLKSHFSDSWNQSELEAQKTDSETVGYLRGKKEYQDKRQWIWFLIAAGVCCFGMGAAVYLLTHL